MEPRASQSPASVASLDEARQGKARRESTPQAPPDLMALARADMEAERQHEATRPRDYKDTLLPDGEIVLVSFTRRCKTITITRGAKRLALIGHIVESDGTLGREILKGFNLVGPGRLKKDTSLLQAFRAVITEPIKAPSILERTNLNNYVDRFMHGIVVRCKTYITSKGTPEAYSVVGDILERVSGSPPVVILWNERLH